jgi:hypothetical protein
MSYRALVNDALVNLRQVGTFEPARVSSTHELFFCTALQKAGADLHEMTALRGARKDAHDTILGALSTAMDSSDPGEVRTSLKAAMQGLHALGE